MIKIPESLLLSLSKLIAMELGKGFVSEKSFINALFACNKSVNIYLGLILNLFKIFCIFFFCSLGLDVVIIISANPVFNISEIVFKFSFIPLVL